MCYTVKNNRKTFERNPLVLESALSENRRSVRDGRRYRMNYFPRVAFRTFCRAVGIAGFGTRYRSEGEFSPAEALFVRKE